MGGCTNCGSKTGCDHRKGEMMGAVDSALEALYPSKTWGEPDERAALALRPDAADLDGLAEELAQELRAATFVRHGGDDEPCDYLYVLCLGRTPCIVQVRDHEVPVPREWEPGVGVSELYLRVCVSHRAPMAAIQQVAMEATYEGGVGGGPGVVTIREAPRAGVYDAPLLSRMQRAVAILPAYGLLHVDFGEIAGPPPGYAAGEWSVLYGEGRKLPTIANYLFFPQPPTMISLACVPAARER